VPRPVLRIELARRTRGWQQWRLGQITRIHQSFISLIEKGQGIPTPDQAARLADALGLDPEHLLDVISTTVEMPGDEEDEERQAVGR